MQPSKSPSAMETNIKASLEKCGMSNMPKFCLTMCGESNIFYLLRKKQFLLSFFFHLEVCNIERFPSYHVSVDAMQKIQIQD